MRPRRGAALSRNLFVVRIGAVTRPHEAEFVVIVFQHSTVNMPCSLHTARQTILVGVGRLRSFGVFEPAFGGKFKCNKLSVGEPEMDTLENPEAGDFGPPFPLLSFFISIYF